MSQCLHSSKTHPNYKHENCWQLILRYCERDWLSFRLFQFKVGTREELRVKLSQTMLTGSCRIIVNLEFKHLSGGKWPAPRCEWDVRQSAVITVRLWHAWGKLKAVCSWNKSMLAWHDGPWREETDTLCHNHWPRIVLNVSGSLNGSFSLDSENVPEDKLHEFSTSQR